MSLQSESTKATDLTTTSKDVVAFNEEVEVMSPQGDANLPLIRKRIRDTLEKVDPVQAQMWDELSGIVDTNELILLNLKQAQAHLQQSQESYYARQQTMDSVLQNLIDKGEEYIGEYMQERERFEKEMRDAREHIQKLMTTITSMAKEYRQCVQQKKFTVHITQVLQWKMAIEASIHRNVKDQRVLSALADDIIDAGRALFPINAGEDS